MDKGKKFAVASMASGITGFLGLVAYFIYMFTYNGGSWFNPEMLDYSEGKFFEMWLSTIKILSFGGIAIIFVILGLGFGIYSMRKLGKENKNYGLARAGTAIGIIGLILSIVVSNIYFLSSSGGFFDYLIR